MKERLMDILACPLCKGELVLTVTHKEDEEIIEGYLVCEQCNITYPIREGIPNMLPPGLREPREGEESK
ncbi:MAG: methytransferase partner Trm112 [Methermicoccaceae archaeon]